MALQAACQGKAKHASIRQGASSRGQDRDSAQRVGGQQEGQGGAAGSRGGEELTRGPQQQQRSRSAHLPGGWPCEGAGQGVQQEQGQQQGLPQPHNNTHHR